MCAGLARAGRGRTSVVIPDRDRRSEALHQCYLLRSVCDRVPADVRRDLLRTVAANALERLCSAADAVRLVGLRQQLAAALLRGAQAARLQHASVTPAAACQGRAAMTRRPPPRPASGCSHAALPDEQQTLSVHGQPVTRHAAVARIRTAAQLRARMQIGAPCHAISMLGGETRTPLTEDGLKEDGKGGARRREEVPSGSPEGRHAARRSVGHRSGNRVRST